MAAGAGPTRTGECRVHLRSGAGRGRGVGRGGGMGQSKALLAGAAPLAGMFGAVVLLDMQAAASTSPLFLAVAGAAGLAASGWAAALSRRAASLVPVVPFAAALALLPGVDTSPVKPFGRFY